MNPPTKTTDPLDFVLDQRRPSLIAALFQGFVWFDRSLQDAYGQRGWPPISRAESQILVLVGMGVTRQKDMAAMLGVSPQAVNQTSRQLVDKGMIMLETDPQDRRQRIVTIPDSAMPMHLDAIAILALLEAELVKKIGADAHQALREALDKIPGLAPHPSPSDVDRARTAIETILKS